ncbi:hypothetical protein DEO72_LG8g1725 [Vigna unguiculata]|uniref:TF-B3 domain-containing protein n=1 Tax=Vigna unguiculata TaxID=3917 RepID=A0A4D6MQ74_VIGUN|nr:hypothetical protein DEO72_LG8g1725 [Vigna unguiculata]
MSLRFVALNVRKKKETIIPVFDQKRRKKPLSLSQLQQPPNVKMSSSRAMSFTNFYQNSVTVMEPAEECLEFEVGFYEQWGKMLLLGTNFFSDPKGNTINIEFEDGLLGQRQFRGVQSIRSFYNVNDVYYVCTVYYGDLFFRIRLFDLDWMKFDYPGTVKNSLGCNPLSSIRFFQAFRVQFIPATMLITVPDYFQIFCRDKLAFNYAVKLYDPLSKMFEIYVDTDESLRMGLFGFSRILSAEGVEMDYNRDSGSAANTQVPVVAPDFEKVLSNYDVNASSLYLDSKFATECWIKGRKSYRLTNDQSEFWDCKIRWTGRSSYECYLTCGWKKFCKENGLAAGDRIRFVVEDEEKGVIYILKN